MERRIVALLDGSYPARYVKDVVADFLSLRGAPAQQPNVPLVRVRVRMFGRCVLAGVARAYRRSLGIHVAVANKGQFTAAVRVTPHHHGMRSVERDNGDWQQIPGVFDAPSGMVLFDALVARHAGRGAGGSRSGLDGIFVDPPVLWFKSLLLRVPDIIMLFLFCYGFCLGGGLLSCHCC
jgi:hypothetical protein